MTSMAARAEAEELMDSADLDAATYARVLGDLAAANRVTLARRPTFAFLRRVQKRAAARRLREMAATYGEHNRYRVGPVRLRILDVGYGQGDMLRAIARWARFNFIEPELVGIDLNPNSAAAARAATPAGMAIDYRTGDYAALAGQDWDVVISSLVAHHMSRSELVAFMRFMEAEASRGWLVNDLHRHRLAALGWPALATLMRWHPIVRHDGALSIRRSYRPEEWPPLLATADVRDAEVKTVFPFRLCVERLR